MPVRAVRLKKRCGAKNRQGNPCQRWAMSNGRCEKHGGKSLQGIAHPNYEHGRRVGRLPTRMIDDAIAAMNDQDLASMRDDIVVLDARVNDLMDRVADGESGKLWRDLREAFREYKKATSTGDADKAKFWWFEIDELIVNGAQDYDAWDEVTKAMLLKEKLVAAETKRMVTNGQMIPAHRALAIFGRIMDAVKDNVTDRHALANISRVAYSLVSGPVIEVLEDRDGQTQATNGRQREIEAEVRSEGREAAEGELPGDEPADGDGGDPVAGAREVEKSRA